MFSCFPESGTSVRFISKLVVWYTNSIFRILFLFLDSRKHQIYESFNYRIYVEEKKFSFGYIEI